MDAIRDLNYPGNTNRSSRNSKAFHHCISVLFEEIELAIQWDRPSILLAIHPSIDGREKAKRYLRGKLNKLDANVIHIHLGSERSDLFQTINEHHKAGKAVFFIEGVGRDKNTYRALNLRREELVEKRLAVVFWLSKSEAKELPRYAPDFWAFRHRAIEFASSRGSKNKALPSGILLWLAEHPCQIHQSVDEKISHQEALLQGLSPKGDASMMLSEAVHHLAYLYWVKGRTKDAMSLLQNELDRIALFQVPQVAAALLNGLAIISYDQKDYGRAQEYLHKATSLDPSSAMWWVNLGVAYHAQGKSWLGINQIKKGIRLAPQHSWLLYVLGYIYFFLGNMDEALSHFEETLRLSRDNVYAAYSISVCHSRTQNLDEYKKSMQYFPEGEALNLYDEICKDALKDRMAALQKLQLATEKGMFPPSLIQRDPVLNLFFKDMKI